MNVPVGLLALAVVAVVLPSTGGRVAARSTTSARSRSRRPPPGSSSLTTLGGATYAWGSAQIVGLAVVSVLLAVVFVLVEQRAAEPVIPLALFRNRMFAAASAVGFVVGFAMFGAIAFLPLFLQVVKGVDGDESGHAACCR